MRPSLLLPLSFVLFACQGSTSPSEEPPDASPPVADAHAGDADDEGMVMRTYAVEPERAREVRAVLGRLLQGAKDQPDRGSVDELGGGRIVVVAPPGIQRGIEQMLVEMAKTPAADHARTVEVSYWFVVGERAEEGHNAADFPAIEKALEQVATHGGPMRFEIVEQASLRSLVNERADAAGNRFAVQHVVTKVDHRYVADLRLRPAANLVPVGVGAGWTGRLETRVVVEPGKLVVVGQTGYASPGARVGTEDGSDRTLYTIVRIDADGAE